MKYEGNNILIVTHGDFCKAVYSYLKKVYDPKKISAHYTLTTKLYRVLKVYGWADCEVHK